MATTLPAIGTCSYNGYTIPVESETIALTATPVQDTAKRTISHVVYSITMQWKAYVAAGSTTDATMDDIRKRLTAQGGAFRYFDKGLGNISVNVPLSPFRKDVVWGPIPRILEMKPSGVNCVNVVWKVEVAFPECDNASFDGAIMEFNYKLTFTIGTNGYQTRNYSGYIKIPMTRRSQADRSIPDNIDDYRQRIIPAYVPGFRRIPGTFNIDEAKTRLDFSIDDEQIGPSFPPPGCVTATASHEYHNPKSVNFAQYMGTIKAEYEMVLGANPYVAHNAFVDLVNSRIKIVKDTFPPGFELDPRFKEMPFATQVVWGLIKKTGIQSVIPLNVTMSEPDIYGPPKANFSFTYMMTFSAFVWLSAGLWRPVPNSDWSLWAQPLNVDSWKAFGNAGLKFEKNQDAIIDLCITKGTTNRLKTNTANPILRRLPVPGIKIDKPSPTNSFLLYENALRFEERTTSVLHQPSSNKLSTKPTGTNDPGFSGVGYRPPQYTIDPKTIIQRRSAPTVYIIMEGRAVRVGYPVDEPKLTHIGLIPTFRVDLTGDGFSQGIVGNVGMPIYAANWRIRYALPNSPAAITALPVPSNFTDNPVLRTQQ